MNYIPLPWFFFLGFSRKVLIVCDYFHLSTRLQFVVWRNSPKIFLHSYHTEINLLNIPSNICFLDHLNVEITHIHLILRGGKLIEYTVSFEHVCVGGRGHPKNKNSKNSSPFVILLRKLTWGLILARGLRQTIAKLHSVSMCLHILSFLFFSLLFFLPII